MNRGSAKRLGRKVGKGVLAGLLGLVAWTSGARAQFTEQDALTGRLNRARALAAANNLPAAAKELEAIRAAAKDETTRDATAIMLMSLYFEQANYGGAQSLLDEAFAVRAKNAGAYFASAGQSLRGARGRLERYRLYSLNVSAADLPDEAIADLDRLRALLERMAEQSKTVAGETPKNSSNFEASALLEDVAALRLSLARDARDRARWAGVLAGARGSMAPTEAQMQISAEIVQARNVVNNTPPPPAPIPVATPSSASQVAAAKPAPAPKGPKAKPTPAPKPVQIARNDNPPAPPAPRPGNSFEAAPTVKTAPPPANTVAAATPKPVEPPPAPVAPAVKAPARSPGQPVEVGQLVYKAKQKRSPTYPVIARNARVTGAVKVFVEVDENGDIARVKSVEGPVLLQRAAEDAARSWKFSQTVIDGQAVRVTGFIVFNFIL